MYKKTFLLFVVLILVIFGVYVVKVLDESKAKAYKKVQLCLSLKAKARGRNIDVALKASKLVEELSVDVATVNVGAVHNARSSIKERRLLCERYMNSPCSQWAVTAINEYKFLIEVCENRGIKHCPKRDAWRTLYKKVIQVTCD